jgi:hypothetical protein
MSTKTLGRRAAMIAGLTLAGSVAKAQKSREPYAPLAHAIVTALPGETSRIFLDEVNRFVKENRLEIKTGPFPKEGRWVANIKIELGTDSMFTIDNFLSENEFYVIAYSHEDRSVWLDAWNKLIDRIESRLGKNHIRIVKPAPSSEQ